MIINLISCPRNISTAIMYSFAQRSDTKVADEPFYAYYLEKTGVEHPGRAEILDTMEAEPKEILQGIASLQKRHKQVLLKNMAHHHIGLNWDYLKDMKNVFLIRDPKQLIASLAQVISHPTLRDIGLKEESEILDYVLEHGSHPPVVIDSNHLLSDPEKNVARLCQQVGIPFETSMLAWTKGAIKEDGCWAKYWYNNVHRSVGFTKQKTSDRPLPDHCKALYHEVLPYYEKLKKYTSDAGKTKS